MESMFRGWRLTIILTILIGIATLIAEHSVGGVEGIRAAIRLTARASFVLFLLAFTASPLFHFLPSAFTRWMRANRRYLGVAFAGSHLIHLIYIILFWRISPDLFWADRTPGSLIAPSIGYLLIFAMALTSSDAAVKAMGIKAWRWLHWIGAYYIWVTFMVAFGKRAVTDSFYLPFVVILLMALLLRIAARISIRRRAATPAATE